MAAASVTARPARLSTLVGPGSVETIVFALSLLTGPVLSRALGDEGRGSLAAVLVPTQLVWWGLALGVPYASGMLINRFGRRELLDGSWGIVALAGLPICAVLFVGAPWLLSSHPDQTVGWFRFGLVAVLVAIPAGTAVQLRLMQRGASWGLSTVKSLHLVINTIAVVALALAGRLTLATALASWLVSFLASRLLLLATFDAWPRARPNVAIMRAQLSTGRAHGVATMATILLGRIDQVFLSVFGTSAELGVYVVAATAAQVSLPLARGFADVVLPDAFARPGADISGRATALVFAISAAIGLSSAAVAPWLIPALFGGEFSASVALLWLLIPGQVLFNTGWVISARHLGSGRPGVAARAMAVAALLNLVAIVPVIATWGPHGAAALTSICQAIFLTAVWTRRERL